MDTSGDTFTPNKSRHIVENLFLFFKRDYY